VVCAADSVAGLRRDCVIFTFGLGRTPHGRVLHGFGPLSGEHGVALLNGALGVSRKRLQVLSSFGIEDLDTERIHGDGPAYLVDLLALANKPRTGYSRAKNQSKGMAEGDSPLLADVGGLLAGRGYLVEYKFGCRGGERIPMVVGHPSVPQERLVAVLDDGVAYAAESNLRSRDRLQPGELSKLGWAVTQVWSVAAFLDPDGEADRIAALVEEALVERLSARTETAPVPVVVEAPVAPVFEPQVLEAPVFDAPVFAAPALETYVVPELTLVPELSEIAVAVETCPVEVTQQPTWVTWEAPLENPTVERNNVIAEDLYVPESEFYSAFSDYYAPHNISSGWLSSEATVSSLRSSSLSIGSPFESELSLASPQSAPETVDPYQLFDYIAPILITR
jgi:hypothetical protein